MCIDKDEFSEFLRERKEQYYNLTLNLLADLETECVYQLNNLIYVDNYNYDDMLLQKDMMDNLVRDMVVSITVPNI